jgi:hypothetical protein
LVDIAVTASRTGESGSRMTNDKIYRSIMYGISTVIDWRVKDIRTLPTLQRDTMLNYSLRNLLKELGPSDDERKQAKKFDKRGRK